MMLRLPLEVAPLFRDWLDTHHPDRAAHVMSLMQQMRGGKDYDADWNKRMRGTGPYAWQIARRMEIACKRLGLSGRGTALRTDLFVKPAPNGEQLALL